MKYFKLDPEEQEIEDALSQGKFVLSKNQAQIKKDLQKAAANTMAKSRNVNLRVTQKTLFKLKTKAASEGIPYQTLAASVLHKYANS